MRVKLFLYLVYFLELLRGTLLLLFYQLIGISVRAKGRFAVASGTRIKVFNDNARIQIGRKAYIRRFCSLVVGEGKLTIGDNFFMNNYSSINCLGEIEIGNDCLIGEGVRLYDHNYDYRNPAPVPLNKKGHVKGKIKIGNNCWLGSNTIVLMNVTIGDNVIIGANNLIYKSIPDNTIVLAKQDQNLLAR